MKILVTGGAGFIGTNCLLYLKKAEPKAELLSFDIAQPFFPVDGVRYIHGDVRSYFHLKSVLKEVSKVFHFAAELGTHETFSNPDIANEVNIGGVLNLLELARDYDFPLFIASKPNVWLNPYSISKEAAEKYAYMYFKEYGVKVSVLKFFSVYGPYQYIYKYQKAVPFFISKALKNEPLLVYGNGEQEADFVYVEDAVRAADLVLKKRIFGQAIEFGWGKGIKINYLAKRIIELAGSKSAIKHLPMRMGEEENSRIYANTEKMKNILKFEPKTNLNDGLRKTIEFYKGNSVKM